MNKHLKEFSISNVSPIAREFTVKNFDNYYSKAKDSLEISYRLWHGWESVEEAKKAVSELGLNEEAFLYIALNGQWNAISMENLGNQIVLNKDIVYYRKGAYSWGGGGFYGDEVFIGTQDFLKDSTKYEMPNIQRPKISYGWTSTLKDDLEELFFVESEYGSKAQPTSKDRYWLLHNAMILLGTTMFDTMVPVFKLNVMDEYMQDSPSRHKLWSKGISKYNYYTKEAEYASKEEIARLREKEEALGKMSVKRICP